MSDKYGNYVVNLCLGGPVDTLSGRIIDNLYHDQGNKNNILELLDNWGVDGDEEITYVKLFIKGMSDDVIEWLLMLNDDYPASGHMVKKVINHITKERMKNFCTSDVDSVINIDIHELEVLEVCKTTGSPVVVKWLESSFEK